MGKATILAGLGSGHYLINVQLENSYIDARLLQIDEDITTATTKLTDLATRKQATKDLLDADMLALNNYITITSPEDYVSDGSMLAALTSQAYADRVTYEKLSIEERREKLKKTGLEKEKDYLTKYVPKEFEATAWCVAFNEGLSGVIKTIEIDYINQRSPVQNVPQNNTGFWLPPTAEAPDSQLQNPMSTGPHAVWYNLAMYPALQKEKARYRVATLTYIDKNNHLCEGILDGVYSIDPYSSHLMNDLPVHPNIGAGGGGYQNDFFRCFISYPPCNSKVFEVGDRVIVQFDSNQVSTVIGFYSNPRECVEEIVWPSSFSVDCTLKQDGSTPADWFIYNPGLGEIDCGEDFGQYSAVSLHTGFYMEKVSGGGGSPSIAGFVVTGIPTILSDTIPYLNGQHIYRVVGTDYEYLVEQKPWGFPDIDNVNNVAIVSFAPFSVLAYNSCPGWYKTEAQTSGIDDYPVQNIPLNTGSITCTVTNTETGESRTYSLAGYDTWSSITDARAVFTP